MNKTVVKLWGAEEWLVNNDLYCAKRLIIRPGFQCSLHYHSIKDETFYVEHGLVKLEVNGKEFRLVPGDSVRIRPLTRHRFQSGMMDTAATILEVSTHHDDADVYRIEESRCIISSTSSSSESNQS